MQEKFFDDQVKCVMNLPIHMNQVVIYCHGFDENKDMIHQYLDLLNDNNIGIIGFDFPHHGGDKTKYQDVTYDLCINYLDVVVGYIEKNYPDIPISIVGSCFGGYIVLNYINDKQYKFKHVFLKSPAVNFYECIMRKLKITDEYFKTHKYFELSSGHRIYIQFYFDIKEHDIMKKFNKNDNNIYMIHGDQDRTVLIEDVKSFANTNKIKLNIVVGAGHEMTNYLGLINDNLIKFLKS